VYRAFVRGKVESLELLDSGIDKESLAAAEKRAIRYFRLAQGYCLRSRLPPTLFITCGTMGCGKSTLASQLAFELGLATYNSDVVRKQLAGVSPETAVKIPFGEGIYSRVMSMAAYRQLEKLADYELSSGHSVVIDAGFGTVGERAEFTRLAASHRAEFVIIYVQCLPEKQLQRLCERASSGTSVSDGRVELWDQQKALFETPDESEGKMYPIFTNLAPDQSLNSLYKRLFKL
jgi:predicted kinase